MATVTRPFELAGEWFTDLCLWLQCPVGSLGAIGWPIVLIPEVVDERFRFGEDAIQIHHQVSWSAPVPGEAFTVSAEVAWESSRNGSVEVGVRSRALAGGVELASSLLVVRSPGQADSWGRREIPPLPEVSRFQRLRTLVVDETQIQTFAMLAGTCYPIHDDIHYAQARGLPNVLVQGHLLVLILAKFSGIGTTGGISTWFRRPVPAGSLLEIGADGDDDTIWAVRLPGTDEVAAVARITT